METSYWMFEAEQVVDRSLFCSQNCPECSGEIPAGIACPTCFCVYCGCEKTCSDHKFNRGNRRFGTNEASPCQRCQEKVGRA